MNWGTLLKITRNMNENSSYLQNIQNFYVNNIFNRILLNFHVKYAISKSHETYLKRSIIVLLRINMINHDLALSTTHSFSYAQSSSGLRGLTIGYKKLTHDSFLFFRKRIHDNGALIYFSYEVFFCKTLNRYTWVQFHNTIGKIRL